MNPTRVAHPRFGRVMVAQFKAAVSEPNEFLKFYMCPDDTSTWYILVTNVGGNNDEYTGGEYVVRMVAPAKFPQKPPSFYFMTPNGVYEPGAKVCISIGEYHPGDYRPVLGMSGFCKELVNGLIGWKSLGAGINIVTTNEQQKKKLADASREHNQTFNSDIVELIENSYREYSAAWKK